MVGASTSIIGRRASARGSAVSDRFPGRAFTVWTLKNGATTVFSMPRAAVLRGFVLSYMIHHRGQLSVYLRLRDMPLPSLYGPTADTRR